MDKKRVGYGVLVGAGILFFSGLVLLPGKKQEELQTPIQPVQQVQPVRGIQIPQQRQYIVKKGDYLSGIVYNEIVYNEIVYNELGLRGRDISRVVDGKLVSGQDGFIDLLYPKERITLD